MTDLAARRRFLTHGRSILASAAAVAMAAATPAVPGAPAIIASDARFGFQFFGEVRIDPQSHTLSVELIDLNGVSQFTQAIAPANG